MAWIERVRPKYKAKWKPEKINRLDLKRACSKLRELSRRYKNTDPNFKLIVHYADSIERCVSKGDILLRYDYHDLCEKIDQLAHTEVYEDMIMIVGELYGILNMGMLIQDYENKRAIEKEWMIREGFSNAEGQ